METKTKELPLVQAADRPTGRLPLVQAPGEGQTRPLPPLPVVAAGSPGPPPFPVPAPAQGAPVAPPPFPAPVAQAPRAVAPATPPPAPVYPQPGAAPVGFATPQRRAPRRWPVAMASWLGGMVAGMALLTLALGLFGGPRTLAAARPAGAGSPGDPTAAWDTSITLTDAYLTAQARKNGTGQVQEPTLRVQADGTIAMDGKVALFGRSVPMTAKLQPSLADGQLQMAIVNLQVGGLPLPQVVIDQIANGVAGATQPPAGGMPATLVRLETTEGKLVIYSKVQ